MKIKGIKIVSGRYKRHGNPSGLTSFKKDLPLTFTSFNSRGKFIWIETNSDWNIWITLGMTGYFYTDEVEGNIRYVIKGSKCNLYFVDDRNFGTIKFCNNNEDLDKKLDSLGQDPLRDRLSFTDFKERLLKYHKNNNIADALLDQRVIAGIGTYLRSEILYNVKQNPFTKVNKISDNDLKKLLDGIKSTMKKFLNSNVEFLIYGQEYTKKGEKIKYKKMKNDRGLYYV